MHAKRAPITTRHAEHAGWGCRSGRGSTNTRMQCGTCPSMLAASRPTRASRSLGFVGTSALGSVAEMMMPAMLMRVSRRWCSSGTPALAEELARKIAQQVRLNAEVSPNVEWFAKHPDGPAPLASYMLSRMLIRSQYAGVALNAQRPPSELSGVEAVDERLVRAISLLEQHGEALEPPAAHDLSPETKMERRALADLLVQAIASGRSAEELDSLVAEWRCARVLACRVAVRDPA